MSKMTRKEIEEGLKEVFSDPNSQFMKDLMEAIEKRKKEVE